MTNGVTVYPYAIIDEIVARFAAMSPGERRQVAQRLVQQAPVAAEALADAVTAALAVRLAESKPVE